MKIYVIYHNELENTNIFTTKKEKINEIILDVAEKTDTKYTEWKYREFEEGKWFTADFTCF